MVMVYHINISILDILGNYMINDAYDLILYTIIINRL